MKCELYGPSGKLRGTFNSEKEAWLWASEVLSGEESDAEKIFLLHSLGWKVKKIDSWCFVSNQWGPLHLFKYVNSEDEVLIFGEHITIFPNSEKADEAIRHSIYYAKRYNLKMWDLNYVIKDISGLPKL